MAQAASAMVKVESGAIQAVLKRRLIFVPLPEPEPLQTGNRADLPSSGASVAPLLDRRPLLQPEPLVNTRGWEE